jgi:ribosomal subunit interface protein
MSRLSKAKLLFPELDLCYVFAGRTNWGEEDMNTGKINVTFRNMDHSAVIEEHIRRQLDRLEKFLKQERTPISVEMIIEAKPVHSHHIIELRVNTPHFHEVVKDEGPDMYLVIDSVISTMNNQIRRLKERMLDDRKDGSKRSL